MASNSVRIDKELFDAANVEGKANLRSTAQQINFWARIGRNALANPDLPVDVVRDLLIAKEEQSEPFSFNIVYLPLSLFLFNIIPIIKRYTTIKH
mgnify:CR=1 FL=1